MYCVRREEFQLVVSNLRKLIQAKGQKPQVNTETLSSAKTLKAHDMRVHFLDPGGSNRDITLPAEEASANLYFYIFNTGSGNDLIVKDDSTPTPNTIVTVSQDEGSVMFCDGVDWRGFVGANT
jgi:hypothetical protein